MLALAALCMGLNSAQAGLEALTNDTRAIVTQAKGEINIPIELGKTYVQDLAVLGRIAREFGGSPFEVGTNSYGNLIFYNENSNTTSVKSASYTPTEKGFIREIGLEGTRPFSDFEAYIRLDCEEKEGKMEYDVDAHCLEKSSC